MTRGRKILYFILAALILALIIYFISSRKQSGSPLLGSATPPVAPSTFPLRFGSKGAKVQALQNYLLANGGSLPIYGADGDWGSETQAAVLSVLGVNEVSQSLYNSLGLN